MVEPSLVADVMVNLSSPLSPPEKLSVGDNGTNLHLCHHTGATFAAESASSDGVITLIAFDFQIGVLTINLLNDVIVVTKGDEEVG